MKVGIKPEVAKVAELLKIMDANEKAIFMRMVDAISATIKENHKNERTEETQIDN